MAVSWSWAIEMYLSAAWTNITRDVVKVDSIRIKNGIMGNSVTDCVGDIGTLSFTLDNSQANSAGLLGYYAPGHANCRTGFGKNTLVRIKFVYGATTKYYKHGRIQVIDPVVGQFGERTTHVQATDFMEILSENKTTRVPIQENKRFDELISTLISNSPTAPLSSSYAVDPSSSELAFHLEKDESNTLMNVAQKICQSTMGKLYLRGNATNGETLVYENRYARALSTLVGTLNNSMSAMKAPWNSGETYGAVKATVMPFTVDPTQVVLASLESEISVRPGETVSVELRLRDPGGNSRISGFDFVDPLVADTDYRVSSVSGNEANDMNAAVTITIDAGSNSVQASITNSTGVVTAYVNLLQVRGRGVYPYDVIDFNFGTGSRVLTYSMPYMSNTSTGRAIGEAVYNRVTREMASIDGVSFYPDANATLMGYFMNLDVGSRVALIETATGVSAEYFINGYEIEIENGALLKMTWVLVSAEADGELFILDDVVKGVLNNTTYLLAI